MLKSTPLSMIANKIRMRKLILMCLIGATSMAWAQQASVSSPDGRLRVNVNLHEGKVQYNVTYDDQQVLEDSPLGFVANLGDFSQNLTWKEAKQSQSPLTTRYTLQRSKQSKVSKEYHTLAVTLTTAQHNVFTIDFRVENNDIALRYLIPNQQPTPQHDKAFSIRILREMTGFDFPQTTTTFLTHQSDGMAGWKNTKPSYEEEYRYDAPMSTRSQAGHGFTFPGLFKVSSNQANAKKGTSPSTYWVLVSETDVDSRYCGSRLSDMQGDGRYTIEFPMPEENAGSGSVEPALALPAETPWRTLTIGNTLAPIVETTIPWDFVSPRYKTSHTYRFGKGTWSWILWQDNSINYEDQVQYIQLAKAMGFNYVLIDNFWDKNIGYDRMEQLVRYAKSQGVEVFLWYSSSGWWNNIEQSPINVMSNSIARKKDMQWLRRIGVKGIKVDFFGGDKQETMRLYEEILSDADDNGLMVIFHGCTIPRGWERMYPNYVGSEAVLASENIYFTQHAADREAKDVATHPFIRNAIGSMEFGGCFMNRHLSRGNKGGNTRRTTDVHELATCVLFQNPIQNFALAPENLPSPTPSNKEADAVSSASAQTDKSPITQAKQSVQTTSIDYNAPGAPAPALCMDFLREVPTTWDETRFIDGYPGQYVVLARRHGNTWYIAGNNATDKPLTLQLNLPMLQKGDKIRLYSDNLKTREPELSTPLYKGKALRVTLASQGGFVLVR